MIHAIYIYLIISGFLFGFSVGDSFSEEHWLVNLIRCILWLPELIYRLLENTFNWVKRQDIVIFPLVDLFGYNPLKKKEQEIRNNSFAELDKTFVPEWQKTAIGRYKIKALRKLQKLNNYEQDTFTDCD
jgi:hypothetical protein